ncbi:hypothetical protein IAI10_07420 [Clostridium sp. 19966]|uniref:YciI family protein n=1 Tax=Clostridium sp. 19966 TaxID=2768166 RepID=UPI0028DF45DC|nr:YciI family protein [Clostridium sp. 19966]MDT8716485.1 hypothetical protein [Clostridium sp. 19966]
MQFLITAYDYKDEDAINRRLAAREEHLKLASKMASTGITLYGGPILDDKEKMIGSVFIVEFTSRNEIDEWFKIEPYVLGNVWENIDIRPMKVATIFKKD